MKILSVEQMRDLEEIANSEGISYQQMMTSAGNNLGEWIENQFESPKPSLVIGLIGSGKNGSDTLIALNYLAKRGRLCIAYLVKPRSDNDPLIEELIILGGKVIFKSDDESGIILEKLLYYDAIVLDGILGTGFKPPLDSILERDLRLINSFISRNVIRPIVIAVDCPSGIDCNTGACDASTIKSDFTACMGAVKTGLMKMPANDYCGDLFKIDIGIPDSFPQLDNISTFVIDKELAIQLLPQRPSNSHKGSFGKCLIYAGSSTFPGAAYLASKAAYLSGAGLVEVIAKRELRDIIGKILPEAIWHEISFDNRESGSKPDFPGYDAFLIGPGIGSTDYSEDYFHFLLDNNFFSDQDMSNHPGTVILDADALRFISKIDKWWVKLHSNMILTPHPGEMAAMTGLSIQEIQENRLDIAGDYARLWRKIVVLKGALTIIANPGGETGIVPIATSALATAGTGDCLAGLITGFCAQKVDPFNAAQLGAFVHAKSGCLAESFSGQPYSVIASDVLKCIPQTLSSLFKI
ncbi:MAG: NAD(P)H-hydrate dehydratase [Anaerolineaceae bacterium]|nr:NAD(P)H-hydrate dehydratase [Anaerolineaceae bacterium]